jgi:hypothetical protein
MFSCFNMIKFSRFLSVADNHIAVIFAMVFMLGTFLACEEKPAPPETINLNPPVPDSVTLDTASEISPKYTEQAFDRLYFGMSKTEVNKLNSNPQRLGKYNYHFSYQFNGCGELYALTIISGSVKTIVYENVSGSYNNLYNIISMKYGKPTGPKSIPSVFDVMNAGTYWINKWNPDNKTIRLGIRHKSQDSYDVLCRIVNVAKDKAEKQRLYELKNKDIIEAAKKF